MSYTGLFGLHWREPLWLLLFMFPIITSLMYQLRQKNILNHYADPALQPWVAPHEPHRLRQRLFSRTVAYGLAWLLFAVAAAGPRLPLEIHGKQNAHNLDVFAVIDISRSMMATDILPSRLQRARLEVLELLQRTQKQRVGVIVYAAKPHLYVPLTSDHDALKYYLDQLHLLEIPTHGSQPGEALELALQELSRSHKNKGIVLITDGDFSRLNSLQQQKLDTSIRRISEKQIPFALLGIGSVEGEAIPLPEGGWLTHRGLPVISRMDESRLSSLAEFGEGYFSTVQDGNSDWKALYDRGIAKQIPLQAIVSSDHAVVWKELYTWALLPAIVLFFISLIPYRFRSIKKNSALSAYTAFTLLFVLSIINSNQAEANGLNTTRKAYNLFQNQQFSDAIQHYQQIPGFAGRYGEGAGRYKLADYSGAIQQFSQAVLDADNDNDRAAALYNLGNSYFQSGNYAAAVRVFEDALRYRMHHGATQHNLLLSKKLKTLVEQRTIKTTLAQQAGRGPRQAAAEQSIQINETTTVILDQTQNRPALDMEIPKEIEADLEDLLQRGLQHVRVAADMGEKPVLTITWQQDISKAKDHMEALTDNNSMLWKRMFEIEEGFPAPLNKPKAVRGITPW